MKKKLPISEEVCALDMRNSMTYIGQFIGKYNSGLTNYHVCSTEKLASTAREKKKPYLDTVIEEYENAKRSNLLNLTSFPLSGKNIVVWHNNILKKNN
ncbi:MAG TPA: hypothetical protein ENG87_02240 [Candidatus Pacearchaeota archaeon]|nr:hypothetical protein BMS3Abin17_01221 [archaeon BMS3Abin17]HDK42174.1 hypothetical protein [Candidatus Pacearchaeota archaeon]HDZ61150.1 hypothetical protein [Candidatus Pacearchaeota archaeon]